MGRGSAPFLPDFFLLPVHLALGPFPLPKPSMGEGEGDSGGGAGGGGGAERACLLAHLLPSPSPLLFPLHYSRKMDFLPSSPHPPSSSDSGRGLARPSLIPVRLKDETGRKERERNIEIRRRIRHCNSASKKKETDKKACKTLLLRPHELFSCAKKKEIPQLRDKRERKTVFTCPKPFDAYLERERRKKS